MKKMFQGLILFVGCVPFLSLHGAEESSTSSSVPEVSMHYIHSKYYLLKAILAQEPDGKAVLKALQQKCQNPKYKLSKEHKKMLKRYNVLIKERYGCFNVKKRHVVCHLVNSNIINNCLNEHSIQDADTESASAITKASGEPVPGKESAEDLEQIV